MMLSAFRQRLCVVLLFKAETGPRGGCANLEEFSIWFWYQEFAKEHSLSSFYVLVSIL